MLTLPRHLLFGIFLLFGLSCCFVPATQAAQLPVKPLSVEQDKKPTLRERIVRRLVRRMSDDEEVGIGITLLGLVCAGLAVLIIFASQGEWGWGLVGILGLIGFGIGVWALNDGETVAVKIFGVLDMIANAIFAIIGLIWLLAHR